MAEAKEKPAAPWGAAGKGGEILLLPVRYVTGSLVPDRLSPGGRG
jgi:hypothetical protein